MILFISNDYKTVTQLRIAEMLRNENIDILFFSFNDYWENEISNSNFKQIRIKFQEILHSHYNYFDINFSINDLIFQDHALRKNKDSNLYLTNLSKYFYYNLKKISSVNKKVIIIGENSRAHETLLFRISMFFDNVHYLIPCTARYPSNRLFLFCCENQTKWIKPIKFNNTNLQFKDEPDYFKPTLNYLNDKNKLFILIKKGFSLLFNKIYDKNDVHFVNGKFNIIYSKLLYLARRLLYYYIKKDTYDKNVKYLFFALQRYPESTVDVLGRYNTNQEDLILKLSNFLPSEFTIYVKEHKTSIGEKPLKFYKKIRKIKNVKIISENISSNLIIKYAFIVASISSTVTVEAFLENKIAFIFSDIYLNKFHNIYTINDSVFRIGYHNLEKNFSQTDDNCFSHYCSFVSNNTFEGVFGDPLTEPISITKENIRKLKNIFFELYHKYENSDFRR